MNLVEIYLVEVNLNLVEMNLVEIYLVEMGLNRSRRLASGRLEGSGARDGCRVDIALESLQVGMHLLHWQSLPGWMAHS